MKTLQDITLGDLLPDSISSDQQVKKSAEAIDPELKTVSGFLLLGAVLANVDKLTSTQLDHIAYSFDLTTWRDYWPLSQKRQVAKTVVAQKCRMGTLSAVKKVLESLGSAVSITEWWQKTPKGAPHTFEVVASIGDISRRPECQRSGRLFHTAGRGKTCSQSLHIHRRSVASWKFTGFRNDSLGFFCALFFRNNATHNSNQRDTAHETGFIRTHLITH